MMNSCRTVAEQSLTTETETQTVTRDRDETVTENFYRKGDFRASKSQNVAIVSNAEKGLRKEDAPRSDVSASTFGGSSNRKVSPREVSIERRDRARNNPAAIMHAIAPHLERSPLDIKIEVVETACLKRGIMVTADGYVRQAEAAALLGISRFTLRNQRLNGGVAIPCRRNGTIIEYGIAGIAQALLARETGRVSV